METKNESEKLFEQYLDSNGFKGKWTHEPSIAGKCKKPDYLLDYNGQKCFFEVKELRKKPNEPTEKATHIDPYTSLRNEIDEAREKFKEYKNKDYCCSLVVFNVDDRQARLAPLFVFGAMLGNLGIASGYNFDKEESVKGSLRNVFLGGGKIQRQRNTTISTIVVLEQFHDNYEIEKALREEAEKQGRELTGPEMVDIRMKHRHRSRRVPRVVIVESPFARVPFPEGLFNGSFDERWRGREDLDGKVERVFIGNKLKELEDLKRKS